MIKKIIITGVKGFIGYQLYLKLKEEYEIFGIDNCSGKGVNERKINSYYHGHFDQFKGINDAYALIHLAAKTGVRESLLHPQLYHQTNVVRSKSLFEEYKNIKKIIYASSSSVKEVLNPYAKSKQEMERIAPDHAIGLRFHTVYGPLGRPDMLIRMLQEDKCDYITNHKRDFTHVYDVISAITTCIKNDVTPGVYDVGNEKSISVKKVADLMGKNLPIKEVENEMKNTLSDCTKLKKFGWKSKIDIERGLQLI